MRLNPAVPPSAQPRPRVTQCLEVASAVSVTTDDNWSWRSFVMRCGAPDTLIAANTLPAALRMGAATQRTNSCSCSLSSA